MERLLMKNEVVKIESKTMEIRLAFLPVSSQSKSHLGRRIS